MAHSTEVQSVETPTLRAVVAVCDDWGIGYKGNLLVANKADMQHFVKLTTGGTVLMGQKTLESFPGARPLKNRRNIVLSDDPAFSPEGVEVVRSLEELLERAPEGAWVIGGASVYAQLLPHCTEVYLTKNHVTCPADAFYPNLDDDAEWACAESLGAGETPEGVTYEFLRYVRG